MNALDLKQTPATLEDDAVYPDSDGEPMAETGVHVLAMIALIGALRMYFTQRRDMYIIGNIFLYYEKGRPQSCKSPDVMVVKGVSSTPQRRSFKTWVEGTAPAVIFEITSKGTADEDVENKRELYERLGVNEYFLFDPLHEYLDQQVMGFRLADGKYEPLAPMDDGGVLSVELGMRLVPEGELLALFEARTGKRVPAPDDLGPLLEEAERNARAAREEVLQGQEETRQAHEQTRLAKQQTAQFKEQMRKEKKRADELEQEVARLRALLPPVDGPKPESRP
jgi:Uma2 family endonuclease